LTNVAAIAAGLEHSLALKDDGTVVLWGYHGPALDLAPYGFTNATAISAGYGHTVGLKADGTLVGWGQIIESSILTEKRMAPLIRPPVPDWAIGCKFLKVAAGTCHCIALVDTCESPTTPTPVNTSTLYPQARGITTNSMHMQTRTGGIREG
jgi:hypothetical protein